MYRIYLYWDVKKILLPYYIEIDNLPKRIGIGTNNYNYNQEWKDIKMFQFTEFGKQYLMIELENPQLSFTLKNKTTKVYIDPEIPLPEHLPDWIKLY